MLPITINTNTPSLNTQRLQSKANQTLSVTMERLASGLRINSAKDDAAGLAISNKMTTEIRTSTTIKQGINNGIGLVQVADSGLSSIQSILQRNRELAVQAANGILGPDDRVRLNVEYSQLLAEIDKIANTTSIFDKYPLKPEPVKLPVSLQPTPTTLPLTSLGQIPSIEDKFPISGTSLGLSSGLIPIAYIPNGTQNISVKLDSYGRDDDLQIFTRSGKHILGTPLDDSVWKSNNVFDAADLTNKVMSEDNAFDAGASYDASNLLPAPPSHDLTSPIVGTYNGMTFAYTGDGDRFELGNESNNGLIVKSALEAFTIDETTEDLIVIVVGKGSFKATTSWGFMPSQIPPTPPTPPTPLPQIQSQEPSKYPILLDAHFQEAQHYLEVERTPADTEALGITEYSILGQSNALKAIEQIDGALQLIGDYRARYGSYNNVLDRAIHGTAAEIESNSSARSRILDTDYAKETTELTKSQITQQAGTAILAQANALPRSILSLLE